MVELKSEGVGSNPSFVVKVTPGLYRGLFFRLDGVSDTGQTLTLADIGNVIIRRQGRQQQYWPVEYAHNRTLLKGGVVDATLSTAGATKVDWYVPLVNEEDENAVFWARDNDEVEAEIQFGPNFTTVMASGTIYCFAVLAAFGRSAYVYKITRHDIDIASGSGDTKQLTVEDVDALLVENTTNIAKVVVEADGRIVANAYRLGLVADTLRRGRIETFSETTPIIEVPVGAANADPFGWLNDVVKVRIEGSGADTITVIALQKDWTPDLLSALDVQQRQSRELTFARKASGTKRRGVEVISTLFPGLASL